MPCLAEKEAEEGGMATAVLIPFMLPWEHGHSFSILATRIWSGLYLLSLVGFTCSEKLLERKKCHLLVSETGSVG